MRLVLIEWVDSSGHGEGWQDIATDQDDTALVCQSVGWLVKDGENIKVIAPHYHKSDTGGGMRGWGVMTIPTRSVIRMTTLKGPKR